MPELPLTTRFTLGPAITPEQQAFLDRHGFVLFSRVASPEEVEMLGGGIDRVAAAWLAEGRTRVFGLPLFVGRDHMNRLFIQRLAFASVFSEPIRTFIPDPRLLPLLDLTGA